MTIDTSVLTPVKVSSVEGFHYCMKSNKGATRGSLIKLPTWTSVFNTLITVSWTSISKYDWSVPITPTIRVSMTMFTWVIYWPLDASMDAISYNWNNSKYRGTREWCFAEYKDNDMHWSVKAHERSSQNMAFLFNRESYRLEEKCR